MSSILSCLPYLFEGKWSGAGIAVFLAGTMALIAACVHGGVSEANRGQDQYNRAVKLWLSECGKPIEACAYDWDRSYTLRAIYAGKVQK